MKNYTKTKIDSLVLLPFTTSGQETDQVYFYNPGDRMRHLQRRKCQKEMNSTQIHEAVITSTSLSIISEMLVCFFLF